MPAQRTEGLPTEEPKDDAPKLLARTGSGDVYQWPDGAWVKVGLNTRGDLLLVVKNLGGRAAWETSMDVSASEPPNDEILD